MNLPKPFLGRLLIEIVKEQAEDHIKDKIKAEGKVSEDFLKKFELTSEVKGRVPFSKGKIIDKAPDAFGEAFKNRFGDVGYIPTIGDIVLFIPNESYRIDPADQYHLLNDCDVCGYLPVESLATKGCVA